MIRINLLPSGKKKTMAIPPSLIYGAIAMVLFILIIFGLVYYLNRQTSSLQAEIAIKEQRLKQLEVTLKRVLNYEKDNEEFRQKTLIIEQLKKNQIIPLRLLDELSEKLPRGVWLTRLFDSGGVVTLDGYAFSNSDLVGYVQNLKSSKYLSEVMLVESRQKSIDKTLVYQFKLTVRITL